LRKQTNECVTIKKINLKGRRKHIGVFLEYQFIVGCISNMAGAPNNTPENLISSSMNARPNWRLEN